MFSTKTYCLDFCSFAIFTSIFASAIRVYYISLIVNLTPQEHACNLIINDQIGSVSNFVNNYFGQFRMNVQYFIVITSVIKINKYNFLYIPHIEQRPGTPRLEMSNKFMYLYIYSLFSRK